MGCCFINYSGLEISLVSYWGNLPGKLNGVLQVLVASQERAVLVNLGRLIAKVELLLHQLDESSPLVRDESSLLISTMP